MLQCNAKNVANGYPLRIEAAKIETLKTDFNPEIIKNLLPKLDLKVLFKAARELKPDIELPRIDQELDDQEELKKVHHALMELDVIEGNLICPESGRIFPINNGIPNMLLNEDEV